MSAHSPGAAGIPDPRGQLAEGLGAGNESRLRILPRACSYLRRGLRSSLLSLTPVAQVTGPLPEESCPAWDFWGFLAIPFLGLYR